MQRQNLHNDLLIGVLGEEGEYLLLKCTKILLTFTEKCHVRESFRVEETLEGGEKVCFITVPPKSLNIIIKYKSVTK